VQGVGFSTGDLSSGELALELDVEGRLGTIYLSQAMWATLGERAGWISKEEAHRMVDIDFNQGKKEP